MLENILNEGKQKRGSDIHLVAGYPPMHRIDGRMIHSETMPNLTNDDIKNMVVDLVGEAEYNKFEEKKEYDMAFEKDGIGRYRGNFHYQQNTIGVSLRRLNDKVPTLAELGLEKRLGRFLNYNNGLVLVTGETGSGKTTTIAALVNEMNMKEPKHIITLEDPIEYVFPKGKSVIEQREIGEDSHTFADALKHLLRQDPDVIFLGELRDIETVSAAITAAETGHLVLATLHTNDAVKTVDRILDIFPKEKQEQVKSQISSSLRGIISQQLIPKIGGGRALAQEILINTPAVANLIKAGDFGQIKSMMEINSGLGMTTMTKALEELYKDRVISERDYIKRKQG